MKTGDIITLENRKGKIVSIEKPPGFNRDMMAKVVFEFKVGELKHVINKKSTRGTSGKKKKTSRRKS